MPLEKYQRKADVSEGAGIETQETNANKPVLRPKLSESLRILAQRARQDALKAGRERALKAAGRLSDKNEKTEMREKDPKERFAQIWDFQENIDLFKNSDNGWRKNYLEGKDEQNRLYSETMSLENFVYDKQLERIKNYRDELINEKVLDSFNKIYPTFEENKIEEKQNEVGESIRLFFDSGTHNELIDKWEVEKMNGVDLPGQEVMLLEMFSSEVFADISKDSPEYIEVVGLFKLLMNDYLEMQEAKRQLYLLNDKMVVMMSDSEMTEEKWLQELAKAAEQEAEKQKEIEQSKEEEKQFFSSGVGMESFNFDNMQYFGPLNAGETLAKDTKIRFEHLGKGEYRILFPPDEDGRRLESRFFARIIDGKEKYMFNDEFMEKSYQVDVIEGVNRAYLERLMGEGLRLGEDYRGPNLNEGILPDEEMFQLAKNMFLPINIENQPMTRQQGDLFKRLLEIIVSKNNNSDENEGYGNLLPVRRRVELLQLVFSNNQMGAKFAATIPENELQEYSVASLCKKLGVPPNNGRF